MFLDDTGVLLPGWSLLTFVHRFLRHLVWFVLWLREPLGLQATRDTTPLCAGVKKRRTVVVTHCRLGNGQPLLPPTSSRPSRGPTPGPAAPKLRAVGGVRPPIAFDRRKNKLTSRSGRGMTGNVVSAT